MLISTKRNTNRKSCPWGCHRWHKLRRQVASRLFLEIRTVGKKACKIAMSNKDGKVHHFWKRCFECKQNSTNVLFVMRNFHHTVAYHAYRHTTLASSFCTWGVALLYNFRNDVNHEQRRTAWWTTHYTDVIDRDLHIRMRYDYTMFFPRIYGEYLRIGFEDPRNKNGSNPLWYL